MISSLIHIARIAVKKRGSMSMPLRERISSRTTVSTKTITPITHENHKNFPNTIAPLFMGLESIRYMVLPSISRAIILPQRNKITISQVISIKERPKSYNTLLDSQRERVSMTRETPTNTIPSNTKRDRSLLRIISRKVLRAILNIKE